ncbi:ABC transporter ATP-binding protein [Oxalobacteraceae bacterium R-40]|uniref:ABC transporter ATP-binding protein n=1 Tax=Keguizhuia sedimenti TaxID=3064264 RepID=A0ABU1BMA0_9BURK|nr:ABC transporter ATP-binding protein [Oxalobacteraceae bacterium R-40]
MSSDDIAIRVSDLSKCYHIYEKPRDRLLQMLARGHKQYFREFWALKNISFEIRKGETVGIIGRNGSGKSTLLQMICGTLTPTNGSIQTNGRIAALLELGSGFNPEFTGRENVYMNAAILGLTKDEVDKRFDDIASFADIGQFIDQPVKKYSSGMMVRLAFSVQSQIDPDILIVDEALAVGDAKFQAKCFERLRQLKENGASILLVTHSSEQIVMHCSSAILLNNGVQIEVGEPRRVVNRYMDLLFGKEKKALEGIERIGESDKPSHSKDAAAYTLDHRNDVFSSRVGYNPHEYRWGDGAASILDFYLAADGEPYPSVVTSGQTILLVVSVRFHSDLLRPVLGITIKTKEGVTVYGVNSESLECNEFQVFGQKGSAVELEASFTCTLASGDYFVSLGIATRHGEEITPHDRRYDSIHIQVQPDSRFFGLVDLGLNLSAKPVLL